MSTFFRATLTMMTAAVAVAAIAPTRANAQQQGGATQAGATASATAAPVNAAAELALKQMSTKLRNVLAAQEAHYSDHGTYTTSMTALGKYDPGLSPARANTGRRDSVSVQVIFAGGRGWTGLASHWGLRGKSCVVYVGSADELPKLPITRADKRTPTEEGVPICDAAPPAPGAAPAPTPATHATPAAQPPVRQ